MNLFKTNTGHLRNIWWVAVFFLVLAAITFPCILISQYYKREISIAEQAVIVIITSWICQLLRRKPFTELTGRFNYTWVQNLLKGCLIGAAIMILPAGFLYIGGWVKWENQSIDMWSFLSATGMFISVAVAEEFLFRGFIFQRLMSSMGIWAAQLIMAGYFLLIHFNNPGMVGTIKLLASLNIFLASIMFGLAFIKTRSLAMPLGIHFMANWVQGTLLGFGVSGNDEVGILKPTFGQAPEWVTGGTFGIEASLFGLIILIMITGSFYIWYPSGKLNHSTNSHKNLE